METLEKIRLEVYDSDASENKGKTKKVFIPKNIEELKDIIKNNKNLVIRGAGTGLVGGAVPIDSNVIDLNKINSIKINIQEKTAEVEAGAVLEDINEEAGLYNLEFPINPSSHEVCTIGGMIATNSAGNRAVKYGKTINWIEEMKIIDGLGRTLKVKKDGIKDFCGKEGTTGVIVSAKIKLLEKKKRTAELLEFLYIEEAIKYLKSSIEQKNLSGIEFLDKHSSRIVGIGDKYHIIAEFEDDRGSIKDETYEWIINLRESTYPLLAQAGYTHIEDPEINIEKFKEFAEFLEQKNIPYFGHAGIGVIHPVFRKQDRDKIIEMMQFVKKLGGNISGEHGIGLSKKYFASEELKEEIKKLKAIYDPWSKLNIGKII